MKILVSHRAGNENTRGVVSGINNHGLLHVFITSIALFPNAWYSIFFRGPLAILKRRSFESYLKGKVITYPFKEVGRLLAVQFRLRVFTRREQGYFSSDKTNTYIDVKTASYLKKSKEVSAVYCFEDTALHTFIQAKKMGVKCLFDEPIGYWRYMRELLKSEIETNPQWAMTIGGFEDSDEKTQRKDKELQLADAIFVASTFTKKSLDLFPGKLANVTVVPYGFPLVNINRIHTPIKNRKIKLLYVGGLSQRKGVSYMFDAIKGLEDFVELSVIGRGDIEKCDALKQALGKCKYLGTKSHDEVLTIMSQSDLLLFPSLFEGFGLVVTEAMSQGTPVITTERTCGPDVITHGKDGWIVEAGSSEAIKNLLIQFVNNPDLLTQAGEECLKTAAKRPWCVYQQEIAEAIERQLEK